MSSPPAERLGPQIFLILLALVGFIALVGGVSHLEPTSGDRPAPTERPAPPRSERFGMAPPGAPDAPPTSAPPSTPVPPDAVPDAVPGVVPELPGGGRAVFAGNRFLVAYYGTASTPALGVLGEGTPDRIMPRLRRAAAPFARGGRTVQPVFELIVQIAHAHPTRSGTYSSGISRARVQRYIDAAHRHGALLVLDLQPGRADFLTVAKRWAWALKDPWVGLALDPEWRMGPRGVPGRRIGSVSAAEVNRVSGWLDRLTARNGLPQKVFMLHQFRTAMVRNIDRVRERDNLAMVQHVDGFGTPQQKLATYRHVIRPRQFALGFKLFYDEDVRRMRPAQVLRIRPRVSFVSFQ